MQAPARKQLKRPLLVSTHSAGTQSVGERGRWCADDDMGLNVLKAPGWWFCGASAMIMSSAPQTDDFVGFRCPQSPRLMMMWGLTWCPQTPQADVGLNVFRPPADDDVRLTVQSSPIMSCFTSSEAIRTIRDTSGLFTGTLSQLGQPAPRLSHSSELWGRHQSLLYVCTDWTIRLIKLGMGNPAGPATLTFTQLLSSEGPTWLHFSIALHP